MGEAILFKGKWAKPTPEEGKSPIFSLLASGKQLCCLDRGSKRYREAETQRDAGRRGDEAEE